MTSTDMPHVQSGLGVTVPRRFWPLWLFAACVVATTGVAALLWPALKGVPYWDDLYTMMALDAAALHHRLSVFVTGDMMAFWRPAELFFNANLRAFDPVGYLPVKLVSLALHGLKAAAIGLIAARLAPRLPWACYVAAALVALLHPIAVSAIIQIDTVSEAFAAASIAWALVFMLDAVRVEGAARRWRLAVVAVLCGLSLLGKESAVPAVAAMPLVGFIAAPDRRKVFRDLAVLTGMLAVIGLAFIGTRYSLGFSAPSTNDGRYNITFGANIPKNLAVIAGSLSYFGNTVTLIGNHKPLALLGFLPALVAGGVLAWTLMRHRSAAAALINGRAIAACVLMALAATAAPSLAPAISEHNAALPSGAFLSVAVVLIAVAAVAAGHWAIRAAVLALVLALSMGAVAMTQKADMAASVGRTVQATRAAIDTQLYRADKLHVCVTPAEGRMYSIYQLPAEQWIGEEMLWARHNWPAKAIDAAMEPAGPGCDMLIPDYPAPATPSP